MMPRASHLTALVVLLLLSCIALTAGELNVHTNVRLGSPIFHGVLYISLKDVTDGLPLICDSEAGGEACDLSWLSEGRRLQGTEGGGCSLALALPPLLPGDTGRTVTCSSGNSSKTLTIVLNDIGSDEGRQSEWPFVPSSSQTTSPPAPAASSAQTSSDIAMTDSTGTSESTMESSIASTTKFPPASSTRMKENNNTSESTIVESTIASTPKSSTPSSTAMKQNKDTPGTPKNIIFIIAGVSGIIIIMIIAVSALVVSLKVYCNVKSKSNSQKNENSKVCVEDGSALSEYYSATPMLSNAETSNDYTVCEESNSSIGSSRNNSSGTEEDLLENHSYYYPNVPDEDFQHSYFYPTVACNPYNKTTQKYVIGAKGIAGIHTTV